MSSHDVDILLPTYNGEKYIDIQIKSIVHQSYGSWNLLIRDDGSKDSTITIINKYKRMYPEKITIINDEKGNLGSTNNVFELMKYSKSKYIMLADQDDIWAKDKVKCQVDAIKRIEHKMGQIFPVLIHSDAQVIDENGRLLASSYAKYSGLRKEKNSFSNILQCNTIQGASCIFNQALLSKLAIIFDKYIGKDAYHDWWLAVVASIFGRIYYTKKTYLSYRQHSRNQVGPHPKPSLYQLITQSEKYISDLMYSHYLKTNTEMCKYIIKYYGRQLTNPQLDILNYYISDNINYVRFIRLKIWKNYSFTDNVLKVCFLKK